MLMHPRGVQSNTLRKRAAVGRGVHGICGCDVRGSAEMERETSIFCLLGRGGSVSRGVRAFPVGNSEGRAQQAFDCCMGTAMAFLRFIIIGGPSVVRFGEVASERAAPHFSPLLRNVRPRSPLQYVDVHCADAVLRCRRVRV
jgi:hypothetical protein